VPGRVNEEQRQCLDDILTSGRHLLQLIDNAFEPSRPVAKVTEASPPDVKKV